MGLLKRPIYVGTVAVVGLATVAMMGAYAATAASAASTSTPQFVALRNSVSPTTDHSTGAYRSSRMSIQVALAPRNASGLARELQATYTKGSASYHKWLAKGQFDARYSPSKAERDSIARYLRSAGLRVGASVSPFLIKATGSSQQIESALRTSISNYKDRRGVSYFSNSTAVRLPGNISRDVIGVVGLTNSAREHTSLARTPDPQRPAGKASSASNSSCETGYVTTSDLFNLFNDGTNFPYGYGDGPGCSGLTPSQTNSIFGAPNAGARGKGAGVTAGVFELSWYQASDIDTWAHQFYGPSYNPPLTNDIVDGGPLNPDCPSGDQCPAEYEYYSNDIEVDADIEQTLAVAPDIKNLVVYNAPNDYTGQTEVDEYSAIANADVVSTLSSSWGVCENDLSPGQAQAENTVFEQMALQGQSMFTSAGDTGSFGCVRSDGTTVENAGDPAGQPWVTGVGGTSLESYNPGTSEHPGPAPAGEETVWNVDNLCSSQAPAASNDNEGGFFFCAETGAGGGGPSELWARPFYQQGPGVSNPAFPSSNCALASNANAPCRETPDVSADADEYTPYAEYCTGNANTPYSECGTFSGGEAAPGWFGIGGTSLSSPLWSALIADRDSYQGHRTGNVNPLVYLLFNTDPHQYFNDITGIGPLQQAATNNGLFPTTPGYDMATGVGSPKFAAWITGA
jgi:subtilase family serine protease